MANVARSAVGLAKIPIVITEIKDAVLPTVSQEEAEQLVQDWLKAGGSGFAW